MRNFILVSAFTNIVDSNNRTRTIVNHIEGVKTVLTTDFNHGKKQYFEKGEAENKLQVLLHVPSYKKNLSIARIWSHMVFAWRVHNYLTSLSDKPEVIYCTMPTSSSAYVCAKYCKKNGCKFVIDVIDLWPDSLLPIMKGKVVLKSLLFPWTYLTRYAYRHADVIMSESVAYAQEAKKYNSKAPVYPIYLGVDVDYINNVKSLQTIKLEKPEDEIWIGYAGSLGNSYDFGTLLDAVKYIQEKCKYKLWLIGDGVRRKEIEDFVEANNLKAEITGFLSYEQLLGYLSYIDIAINIFRSNTRVVYSYKFNDYVAMDCFVLNSLEGETAKMVDEYRIGRNFDFSMNPLSQVLEDTLVHWDYYSLWRGNTQHLINEKLDKKKIYTEVKEIIKASNV